MTQTFIAVSPDGMDPCELRLARGDTAVSDMVSARVPLVEFAIRSALAEYDLETVEGRVAALQRTAPLVGRLKDRALRPEYARRLAGWLGMEVEPVASRVAELSGQTHAPGQRRPAPTQGDAATAAVERELVKLAVQLPILVAPQYDSLDEDCFTSESLREVHALIAKAGGVGSTAGGETWVAALREAAGTDEVGAMVTRLAVESPLSDLEPDDRYAGAVLARVQELAATRATARAKATLQRLNPVEEPERYGKLFAELISLEQTVRALRERGISTL